MRDLGARLRFAFNLVSILVLCTCFFISDTVTAGSYSRCSRFLSGISAIALSCFSTGCLTIGNPDLNKPEESSQSDVSDEISFFGREPNSTENLALTRVIRHIRRVLGKDHEVYILLEDLRLKRRILMASEVQMPEGAGGYYAGYYIVLRWKIFKAFRDAESQTLDSPHFWSLLKSLLHEGVHGAHLAFDPETARLTSHYLQLFFPERTPQAYEGLNLTKMALDWINYWITNEIEESVQYSLIASTLTFQDTGVEQINEAYLEYQKERFKAPTLSEKTAIDKAWAIKRQKLSEHWSVPIPERGTASSEECSVWKLYTYGQLLDAIEAQGPVLVEEK